MGISLLWVFIALVLERTFGVSYLFLPLVVVIILKLSDSQLPLWMVVLGVLADLFMGRRFGISSLLLLIGSLEFSVYRSKFEMDNFWSVFVASVLLVVQAQMLYGKSLSIWDYALHGVAGVGFWVFFSWWERRGYGGDLYLKTKN